MSGTGDLRTYMQCVGQLVRRPTVARSLALAALDHRAVEREFRRRLLAICPHRAEPQFPFMSLAPAAYLERNFFSILFLSIYAAIGLPAERRRLHGTTLHAVRALVTATDNILDHHQKGPVTVSMGGTIMPNVFLLLLEDQVLAGLIDEAAPDAATALSARAALMGALFEIAHEESGEEGRVDVALPPDEVLEGVHAFRGGKLLQLAFVVPEACEPEFEASLAAARAAVFRIGLGLQMLDDVTDLSEDVRARNHNVLRSWIVHKGPDGQVDDGLLLSMAPQRLAAPEVAFPRATAEVTARAVAEAVDGFAALHELSHPIDRTAALEIVRLMFRLRGLGRLWEVAERSLAESAGAERRA
jgi:hypothetical protein